MSEKFLSKEGLDRFFGKIKSKFAPIDSPAFKGTPTVETPEFERMTDGKELINREYGAKLYDAVIQYFESEKSAFHVRITVKPEEWEGNDSVYSYFKLKEKFRDIHLEQVSVFIRVDTMKLPNELLKDAYQNYPVAITEEGVIYTVGVKPIYELPIIIDLFLSTDMTMWLGGN